MTLSEGVAEAHALVVSERVASGEDECDAVCDTVREGVVVAEAQREGERVPLGDGVKVTVGDAEGCTDVLGEEEGEPEAVQAKMAPSEESIGITTSDMPKSISPLLLSLASQFTVPEEPTIP